MDPRPVQSLRKIACDLTSMWVNAEAWDDDVLRELEPYVYDWVAERRGSISAEHGLGQMKSQYIG